MSVLGGQTERDLTMKALEKSRGFLQAKINASLHMKRTPQLQFFYDDTLDNALRIERALKREAEVLGEEPHEIPVPGEEPEAAADEADGGSGRGRGGRRRGRGVKPLAADLDALCRRMRGERRVALAVHEKPDADALGAAAGMLDLFAQLGVDAELYVSEDELLPLGDVLLPAGRVRRGAPPADAALYALDSGNPDRLALPSWGDVAVNIDHHHDNPRYGELAFVRGEASSTSELVCDIARALGLQLSPQAAAALYAGISFDTGHFHHDSTAPSTFRTAAWLVELGVDVTGMYALLYESRSRGVAASLGARRGRRRGRRRRTRAARRGHARATSPPPARDRRRPTASSTACAASTGSRSPPSSRNRPAARACASACARRPSTSAPSPPCRAAAATSWPPASPATTAPRR